MAAEITCDDNDTDATLSEDIEGLQPGDYIVADNEIILVNAIEPGVLETNLASHTNNDLKYTAKNPGGSDDNGITIEYNDPGADGELSVEVAGKAIKVNLAYATGAVTSTADDVKSAVDSDVDASALVSVANKSGNDGSGLVSDMNATPLAGGSISDMDRAQYETFAASHTDSAVYLVSRVDFGARGPEVYYIDSSDNTLHPTAINTVALITQAVDDSAVDDLDYSDISPGQLVCTFDPLTKAFKYKGKMWDNTALVGTETLDED